MRKFALILSFSFVAVTMASAQNTSIPLKPNTGVRAKVDSITKDSISLQSTLGPVKAKLGPEVKFYKRVPATLAQVTPQSFVGVTTVKQPDGTEQATEIHIFPEELRGSGEGSHVMDAPPGKATQSKMTNGTVSTSRMTNGTVTPSKMTNGTVSTSRMTNGTVQKAANPKTMIVNYGDGSQPIVIPPDVTVTAITQTSDRPSVGDDVFFVPVKNPNGTYTTKKITLIK
jgi:hypothetical protein